MRKVGGKVSLEEQLERLLQANNALTVGAFFNALAGRGLSFLLMALSLPFCQPLQIPGFSTPFGLMIAVIGLHLIRGGGLWLPRILKEKVIPTETLQRVVRYALHWLKKCRRFLHRRWDFLVTRPWLHFIHGVIIIALGLILALPLPIPLTNFLAALPLFFFGLGLLEDDGLMILVAYGLALICFSVFFILIWFGKEGVSWLWGAMVQY